MFATVKVISMHTTMIPLDVLQFNGNVGNNNDSVGCVKEHLNASGYRVKRAVIAAVQHRNIVRPNMKKILPIVVKPSNRWGVAASISAT